ncbi:MAG TPA: endonuclease/exonuclease/phosphatase family protein [Burkholderiales bacterium]|nr:endonuclease/exonuclease/phosphatase family protein [Burkholderiales bacterium]
MSEPSSAAALNVATYNIHKGFSHFNRRMTVHELRDRLRSLGSDVVFLQEVVGKNARHAKQHLNWPSEPQHEFLADRVWTDFAYGRNAIYDEGHHGNAILSRYPIVRFDNEDISTNPMERRGLLHAEMEVPGWTERLHCVCVHLGLFASGRRKQVQAVCDRISSLVPNGAPLVLAGDFNDWRSEASHVLGMLGVMEVFEIMHGHPARSFPARLPILRLDRIYMRGFSVKQAEVHRNSTWIHASDHAALTASLVLL